MFENEYKMDIRRYQRWTTPIFYKVLSFWPWLFIFLLSTVGAIIFYKNDLPMRWKSLALMLMLISVYRSVLFRPMLAGKQFKLMRSQKGKKFWNCKVVVGNTIRLYEDGEFSNEVFFKQVKKCVEAKSYFDLAVSLYLKEELEALGMEAILTRSDERALAEGKKADMAARGKIMNGEGVDLVVSVHMNKFTDPSVHGPMAFYMKGSAEGEKLAKTVIDSITDELGAPRRIANPGDYYVIRESMPVSVLVECGFLSNSGDEALLQQEQHQKKLAHAIARGIFSYFEGDLGRKPLD